MRAGANFAGHSVRTPGQAVPGWKPPEKISLGWDASLLAPCLPPPSPLCTAGDVKQGRELCLDSCCGATQISPRDTYCLHPEAETRRKLPVSSLLEHQVVTVAPCAQCVAGRTLSGAVRKKCAQMCPLKLECPPPPPEQQCHPEFWGGAGCRAAGCGPCRCCSPGLL